MPKGDYDRAKQILAASPERYFPGGETRGSDYFFRRRPDDKTPSAHIAPDSVQVVDFGDPDFRGSVLDVYAEILGITVAEAVKQLAGQSTERRGDVQPRERKTRKDKPQAMLPVPEAALKALNAAAAADYVTERHGKPVKGWRYVDAEGRPLFCVVRYEKDGSKAILPWYYGTDGKWHQGQAYQSNRPLYGLDRLAAAPDLPVLVVEGERCADVQVPGYVVVTWAGGSSAVAKTDWSPLAKREVIVWPDLDEPGFKAARAIKARLPHARVMDLKKYA